MSILRQRKGFTLIELLAVVVIIGILASIAVPAFIGARADADAQEVNADLSNAVIAAKAYAIENDGSLTGLSLDPSLADKVAVTSNDGVDVLFTHDEGTTRGYDAVTGIVTP